MSLSPWFSLTFSCMECCGGCLGRSYSLRSFLVVKDMTQELAMNNQLATHFRTNNPFRSAEDGFGATMFAYKTMNVTIFRFLTPDPFRKTLNMCAGRTSRWQPLTPPPWRELLAS